MAAPRRLPRSPPRSPARPRRLAASDGRPPGWLLWLAGGILFATLLAPRLVLAAPAPGPNPNSNPKPSPAEDPRRFRVGISSQVLGEVNPTDARVSLQAWGRAILQRADVPYEPEMAILSTPAEIRQGYTAGDSDLVLLTAEQCLAAGPPSGPWHYFVDTTFDPSGADQYVLLARQEAAPRTLGQLRGATLAILDHSNNSLARPWLDLALLTNGLPAVAEFFKSVSMPRKLSATVLPVFFGSVDAALVPRRGYDTMCELNPQIRKRLGIIAQSGLLLSRVICFNARLGSPYAERIRTALRTMHESPAGQQILNLFQAGRTDENSADCLESARRLLAEHQEKIGSLTHPPSPALATLTNLEAVPPKPTPPAQRSATPPPPAPAPIPAP